MKCRGFTLLELLVAMAIFATAGLAIMQSSAAHIRSLTQLEDLTLASYVANNQLQLAMLELNWPPKSQQGQLEMGNRQWQWHINVTAVPDKDLRQLEVLVSLQDQPEETLARLITFLGKPGV